MSSNSPFQSQVPFLYVFFVNTVQKSCSNTKNLKKIYFVLFCSYRSNSFNTSSIVVFFIKTTGINQLYLFNDFCRIVSMIERFWSCTEMVFHGSSWCWWTSWFRIARASPFCSLLINGCVWKWLCLEDNRLVVLNATFVKKSTSSGSWNLEYFLIRRNSSSISTINRKTNNPIVLNKITKSKL